MFNVVDVAVFSKLKEAWKKKNLEFMREKKNIVTVNDFPYVFQKAWKESVQQGSIVSGISFLLLFTSRFQNMWDLSS